MRRVFLISVLATIFVLLFIMPAACQAESNNKSDNIPVSNSNFGELIVPSAQHNIESAYDLAKEWSADAILISVGVIVPSGDQLGWMRFSFISKTNFKEYLLLSYQNSNVTTRISDWNASYNSFREIEFDQWLIDSTEAFEVAQRNGGQEHMLDASGDIEIGLSLGVAKNGTLVWRVSYRSLDGTGTMYIGVNATSGEFIWIDLP